MYSVLRQMFNYTGNFGINNEKMHYHLVVDLRHSGRIISRDRSIHFHHQRQKVLELLLLKFNGHIIISRNNFWQSFKK